MHLNQSRDLVLPPQHVTTQRWQVARPLESLLANVLDHVGAQDIQRALGVSAAAPITGASSRSTTPAPTSCS